MKRSIPVAVLMGMIVSLFPPSPAALAEEPPKLDVPYVPTPQPVVTKMLEMANVQQGDVVYDLGCGDGRIVITAAKDYGAQGIGVDIDPQRIAESKQNAEKAGVSDRVKFLQQDLFTMDFSDADVLAMYLLPSVNVKLRDKILELKPGTRIVSHAFDMGEWKPDDTATVEHRSVYFWVVPAKVQGTWTWQAETPRGREPVSATLQQQFQEISGTARVGDREYEIVDGKLAGDALSLILKPADGNEEAVALRYEGRVQGDQITGVARTGRGAEAQPAAARGNGAAAGQQGDPEWSARRQQQEQAR